MDITSWLPALGTIASWLQATGPYGLVVILGWALWKKDAQLRELSDRLAEMERAQTAAMTKVDDALGALKADIDGRRDKTS